jgi:hypothetical protein
VGVKMTDFYRFWFPGILFALIGILCFIGLGYMHEAVHKEIFLHYGIDSKIHLISDFPHFSTEPMGDNLDNCGESCMLAHDINEVVGYQMLPIFMCFILFSLMFFFEILFLQKVLIEILRRTSN